MANGETRLFGSAKAPPRTLVQSSARSRFRHGRGVRCAPKSTMARMGRLPWAYFSMIYCCSPA